jgi:peptidoglycan/LPS O-acetylase OafA/YrhL
LHHAVIWYFYLRTGVWQIPPSYLYTHFGQSSVILFFMITAFLFSTKLLQNRYAAGGKSLEHPLFWQRLYVSRILRLTPLYFFVVVVVLLLTAIESNFQLREPLPTLLVHIGQWVSFTVFGSPDVNGLPSTFLKIAGVSWTLPYEWFFYFSLPILTLLLRVAPPLFCLILSVLVMLAFYFWQPATIYIIAFVIGVIASLLVKLPIVTKLLNGSMGSLFAILCLTVVCKKFPSVDNMLALTLLGMAFTVFASGNTFFGVLKSRTAQAFGEISYSIYLLHGLTLYIMFKFVLGFDTASKLSVLGHWGTVLACTVVLIPLCFATFRWIEAPAIRFAPKCSRWLENRATQFQVARAK